MVDTPHNETFVDVLVIGAGPAGLMCANGLAKAGVKVKVVDKRPSKVAAGQADGIQPRTIEVLQSYGLAERLIREGNQMHMAAFYNPSPGGGIERTHRAPDVTAPTARFPFEVTLHQGAIEQIFLDSLASSDVHIDRPVIPMAIDISNDEKVLSDPSQYAVKVVLQRVTKENLVQNGESTEIVRAKFVVGCDGAHSWVRKALGITMDGEQTEYVWGVVDLVPDTDFPDIRNRTAIHSHNGSCMIIPREGDKVRLYLQLTETDFIVDGRVDRSKMGPERLLGVATKSLQPYHMSVSEDIDWWTIYIIGHRVASQFSVKDRVFIAGDACHTHSPKAGQGMNASMNDTHNLIWKITQVLRSWANPSLLSTYQFERRKYAQDLINFDKDFSALFSGKPYDEEKKTGVSHSEFLKAFQTHGEFTSGIGIHYATSDIVNPAFQDAASNLVVGKRMLPHTFIRTADSRPYEIQDLLVSDTRFKILVFVGDINSQQQREKVNRMASTIETDLSVFSGNKKMIHEIFDIFSVSAGTKEEVDYMKLPPILRSHWSKALLDDVDVSKRVGSHGYAAYGISPTNGACVVVRPDGYVGFVCTLEQVSEVYQYLTPILLRQA